VANGNGREGPGSGLASAARRNASQIYAPGIGEGQSLYSDGLFSITNKIEIFFLENKLRLF
jgi:hypothetical protein